MATLASELARKIAALERVPSHYRSLNEFTNMVSLPEHSERVYGVVMNAVYKGREKNPTRPSDIYYDGNWYYIALRHGEFHAQIDKAMSEIYKHFLGYGPDVDIVREEVSSAPPNFYIASRAIKNLMHAVTQGIEIIEDQQNICRGQVRFDPNCQDLGEPAFKGYTLTESGLLEKRTNEDDVTLFYPQGAGSMAVLTFFFGESDIHDKNWAIQEQDGQDKKIIFYKIDNAESLDMALLKCAIAEQDINALRKGERSKDFAPPHIPKVIVRSPGFQTEVSEMLRKIAETDFSVIKEILSRNITTTEESTALWMADRFDKFLAYTPEKFSEEFGQSLEQGQEFLNSLQESFKDHKSIMEAAGCVNVTAILEVLEIRHRQLRVLQTKPFTFLRNLHSDLYNQQYLLRDKGQDRFSHDKKQGYTRYTPGVMSTP